MSLEDLREELEKLVEPGRIKEADYRKKGSVVELRVKPDQVRAVATTALNCDLFLEFITAVDFTEGPELIYQFNSFDSLCRLRARVQVKRGHSVPSISSIYNAALWHEREVFDLFGLRFKGHPDIRRLLLPEDADFHPLLKNFGSVHGFRSREEIYGQSDG